jgi:hypothetical protein
MRDESLVAQARAEFAERLEETPFVPLIPDGVQPPINPI